MTPELVERDGRLIVSAKFNAYWRAWCREHGGSWDRGSMAWVFPASMRAEVEAALAEIFGGDDDA